MEQRADDVRVIRGSVFQVEGMTGVCKGPEAEPGGEADRKRIWKIRPGLAALFLWVNTAACRPTSIPEPQGDNRWESAWRGRAGEQCGF